MTACEQTQLCNKSYWGCDMNDAPPLSVDQQQRIEATLKRIRAGLEKYQEKPAEEPVHVYQPEAINDKVN